MNSLIWRAMSSMRPRSASWSVDSPHSGRACAATSSYCATRSRHWGWREIKSATIRLTRGSVRLASARVKYFLFPDNDYPLDERSEERRVGKEWRVRGERDR